MSDPVYIGYYTLTDAASMPSNARFIMYDPAGPGSYNITGALLKAQILASPVITGTTTIPAGTAALPSLTTAGDLNTGVHFPAADTVGIATGGSERARITSAGALLVGRTAETTVPKLQVGFANPVASPAYSASVDIAVFNSLNAAALQVQGPTTSGIGFSSDTTRSAGYIGYTHSSGTMEFRTNSTANTYLFSDGNFSLGSGTNSGYKLYVNGTTFFNPNIDSATKTYCVSLVSSITESDSAVRYPASHYISNRCFVPSTVTKSGGYCAGQVINNLRNYTSVTAGGDSGTCYELKGQLIQAGHFNANAGETPSTILVKALHVVPYAYTGTITSMYGLFIANQAGTATVTNKWGVYQEDGNYKNYFAGEMRVGSITEILPYKLQVYTYTNGANGAVIKNASTGTAADVRLTLSSSNSVFQIVKYGANHSTRASEVNIYQGGTSDVYFATNDAERLRIKGSTGNVLVGENNTDPAKFQVVLSDATTYSATELTTTTMASDAIVAKNNNASDTGFAGIVLKNRSTSLGAARIAVTGNSTTSALAFLVRPNSGADATTERMRITSSGNVLIGRTSNSSGLTGFHEIAGNSVFSNTTATTNAFAAKVWTKNICTGDMTDGFGTGYVFSIEDNAGVHNNIAHIMAVRAGADNSGAMLFTTYNNGSGGERARITPTGNLLVGTPTDPGYGAKIHSTAGISLGNTVVANGNVLDWYEEGTFTATATGMTTAPTGTVKYTRNGNIVVLDLPAITGTSNATTFTLTGMPTQLRPAATKVVFTRVADNGGLYIIGTGVVGTDGVISLYYGPNTSNVFTSSGTKTLSVSSVTYTLQ